MKHNDLSPNKISKNDWQLLGELELAIDTNVEDVINWQLAKLLKTLNLHADFLNRILKSAQDAVVRALQAEPVMRFSYIHLLLFVPLEHGTQEKTWGFFRIEKIESIAGELNMAAHTVEFYLYVEG